MAGLYRPSIRTPSAVPGTGRRSEHRAQARWQARSIRPPHVRRLAPAAL